MRAFWSAVVVAIVVAVIGAYALERIEKPAELAYQTSAVRL